MHQSFSQRQSSSYKKSATYSRNQSHNKNTAIGSSRQFGNSMGRSQGIKQGDKQSFILQNLHSENEMKIRSFRDSFYNLNDVETIQFEDGSRYEGQILDDGIREGIGIFQTADGDIYLGDWQNDLYHGYGLYIYHDGQRYEGQLVEGMKEGEGNYFYKDGRVYQGQWAADQREGQGVEKDQIKEVYYIGQWANDQKQGEGKVFPLTKNQNPYHQQPPLLTGIWSHNVFIEGVINSQVYQGEFRNQTLTGKGVYKFPDGSVYNGEFRNNLFHGRGIYYFANGDVYEGSFVCGLKSGSGVYKYFTGDIYDGEYEKDLKSGQGKFVFVNGSYYIGQFQKDLLHGQGKYFFNPNQSITATWNHGKLVSKNSIQQLTPRSNTTPSKNIPSIYQTTNKDLKNPSPLKYPSSLPQRSNSPFTNDKSRSQHIQRQEKTGMLQINPNKSPIKNSKFIEIHTPSDSYFKKSSLIPSSAQNFNQTEPSKQKIYDGNNNLYGQSQEYIKSIHKSNRQNFNNQLKNPNEAHFNRLLVNKFEVQENQFGQKNRSNKNSEYYQSDKKIESKNLYNLMNEDLNEEGNRKNPSLPLNDLNSRKPSQVPKKSKRKLQY